MTVLLLVVALLWSAPSQMAQPVYVGSALPPTCVVGQLFLVTGASGALNVCTETDTWVSLSDGGSGGDMLKSENLSGLANYTTARTNMGLGSLATQSGTFSGTSSNTNTGDQTSIVGITGTLAQFNTALTGSDFTTGGGTATGTNTGDQASIVGITGTLAQFNTAITDADLATGGGTATGTNTGDQTTVSGNAGTATTLQNARTINGTSFNGSANITLGNGSVTLAQMADMATASLIYRKTAGTGVPEVNTLATVKTDLALVKADVGLGNVDNTSDANKPVSTAEQTALNLKANLASPTFTGTVVVPASTAFTTPVIGAATGTSLAVTGALTSSGTAGVGYATGAGGAVTQLTSKATATPAINKPCGTITMNAAALAAAAIVSFVVTNNIIGANDIVHVQHDSVGTFGAYYAFARSNVAATSFTITVKNISAGSLSEAIVLRFCIIKGAVS